MTDFRCWNEDCIYERGNGCTCPDLVINIGQEFDYGCDSFKDYTKTAEYQEPYWKACADSNTGEKLKVLSLGKKINVKGEVFFTEIKDIEHHKECSITHGRTGLCGEYQRILDRWDLVEPQFKELPDVKFYPEGYINAGRCYKLHHK